MSLASPTILWFRRDLRLADNPALVAAIARGAPLIPIYVLDPDLGAAQRWWLNHSLESLGADLARLGTPLILKRGDARDVVLELAKETGAGAVYWNRLYDPEAIARDTRLKSALRTSGILAESFNASLLREPWEISPKGSSAFFQVFTPFWKSLAAIIEPVTPARTPMAWVSGVDMASDRLEDWRLLPVKPDWAAAFGGYWSPGEAGARFRLERFLDQALSGYADRRDFPDGSTTSGLSPHLHWGEIGPRQVWRATRGAVERGGDARSAEAFLRELGWREFSHHLLFHAPTLPERCLRPAFEAFPWAPADDRLRRWQRGLTGYPMVDAGMRELWTTGWMHNRVRMIVGSFLVKHLRIDWRHGAAWFKDTLLDADLANNSASWQWVAGCGADAAPYFRIFNPMLQGAKFDPEGGYVRRWIPELARLPDRFLHAPWTAPTEVLAQAGVRLGIDYPTPVVAHEEARASALAAFAAIQGGQGAPPPFAGAS